MKGNNPDDQLLTVPLDRRERRYLKHKWHRRIFALSTAVTLLAIILATTLGATLIGSDILDKLLDAEEYTEISGYVSLVFLAPFGFLILRMFNSAKYSATGAIASPQQFENVYSIVKHYSQMAGLKRIPTVAIVNDGDFVAKTVSNFGRAVILVHSDLVDAPRPDSEDWGALRFAVAREVGHVAAGHRNLIYELLTAVTQAVPYLSHPLLRAEAYTADRYGAALAPEAAADYFAIDAVSKDCWLDMSIQEAVARAGRVRIGQMITGFTGKVPPTVWRLQALAWFGIFNVKPLRSSAKTPDEYSNYLEKLPTLPISINTLKHRHAAFWFPPKPMPKEDLDKLSRRGTNLEILTEAFADAANQGRED